MGPIQSIQLKGPDTIPVEISAHYEVTGQFSKKQDVDLTQDPYVTWSSSDPFVFTTSTNGWITPTGPGVATITARYQGKESSIQIEVQNELKIIRLSRVAEGSYELLFETLAPRDAYQLYGTDDPASEAWSEIFEAVFQSGSNNVTVRFPNSSAQGYFRISKPATP